MLLSNVHVNTILDVSLHYVIIMWANAHGKHVRRVRDSKHLSQIKEQLSCEVSAILGILMEQ